MSVSTYKVLSQKILFSKKNKLMKLKANRPTEMTWSVWWVGNCVLIVYENLALLCFSVTSVSRRGQGRYKKKERAKKFNESDSFAFVLLFQIHVKFFLKFPIVLLFLTPTNKSTFIFVAWIKFSLIVLRVHHLITLIEVCSYIWTDCWTIFWQLVYWSVWQFVRIFNWQLCSTKKIFGQLC